MRNASDKQGSTDAPDEPVDHQRVVAFLATKSTLPIDEVTRVYEREWAGLEAGARIKRFVTVLAIRRVRDLFRKGAAEAPMLPTRVR
jgi:uncharacterized protein DUF3562